MPQNTNSQYRFSPIKTEKTLFEAIEYTYEETSRLLQEFSISSGQLESITIFSHYPDEYSYLSDLLAGLGKSGDGSKYIHLKAPLKLSNGQELGLLRVRQPDPYRYQVGCCDFTADFEKVKSLTQTFPNNIRLIERPDVVLIEISHPDYDVLAYVEKPLLAKTDAKKSTTLTEAKLFADGGSRGNPGPSASGYAILDTNDNIVKKEGIYLGITTNNQAEYRALKFGMEEAIKMGIKNLHVYLDSLLVVNQMNGLYKIKNRDLLPVYTAIKELTSKFAGITFNHVPRELNKLADGMVNEALDAELV